MNDQYGHEAGDRILVQLAQLFKGSVRATDYVIRWGGEEFVVIMPGCDSEQAMRVAEKMREKIKYEIAEELGLSDKVDLYGWGGLTAEETGRIGGIMTKRKKELKLPTNDQILGRK